MKALITNCSIVHPGQKLNEKNKDIFLVDGVIKQIGNLSTSISADKVIDLKGNYVVPGFFDMHVHLREPGREDEETIATGCNSAAFGGFTGIACMPNTEPAIDSAEVVKFVKEKAADHLVDVFPVAAATVGRKGEVLSPIAELYEAGVVGLSDDGTVIKTASILKRAFEYVQMYNLPIIEHCEDESLSGGAMNESINSTLLGLPPIPSIAEDLIVMRDIIVAEYTKGQIHIAHISTRRAIQLVREAKAKGIRVTSEVAPHHFTLTDDSLKTYDTNYKMNPPLRTNADIDEIILGLKDGTIDCIACDHAPHSFEEKEAEFEYAPYGIIGLETSVGLSLSELLHKKILSLEQLVEKLSINPRKILNQSIPQFKEGEIANFTFLNIDEVWTVDISKFKSKSKNSPFDKRLLTGKAIGVVNNKKMLFGGEFIDL
ncbi:MAG: dihydroorotase [Ignavibacteria bacterium RIFOXYB2_FULL_35_12]|nr:MAG: dihydroorotase [Ignavibacteria bacterium GWA2_36_19]OGU55245.1 MAG: dihydroorotase [Ignavibacteria bacterium GWC2_35_8]OGU84808.1 MAG: dihydroorotase [Ignavibacteria bacterium RIFOXYA12_FULL_35_25]OGU89073.1 MAG: dihydroorotase [Ignavibacteria bacterium RIFOXYC12_FULL_35_11]OGU94244.1 MAG: dihydroorotase [Ignavibacteria bacterium RIFOXYB12_FULL_35_14]OGV00348.1 MAG: dihydroorotase [Ignavibacteria bacterium RIFOXYC2_FULL_35_16]OGV04146.1 MAG: dihydroorotase [Ignavibacteria bacterium RI